MNTKAGAELLRLLGEFKKLDAKRPGLNEAEEARWQELKHLLETTLDKDSEGKRPKRQDLRVSCSKTIKVRSAYDLKKFYIENISGGGLYIASDTFLNVGSKIQLEIIIENKGIKQTFDGTVAWVNPKAIQGLPPGMGIKFDSLSRDQNLFLREIIHAQLDRQLGKPET